MDSRVRGNDGDGDLRAGLLKGERGIKGEGSCWAAFVLVGGVSPPLPRWGISPSRGRGDKGERGGVGSLRLAVMSGALDLGGRFVSALGEAQGEVVDCGSWAEVLERALAACGSGEPLLSPEAARLVGGGRTPDLDDAVADAADQAVGVAVAELGIAATGSVLLVEPDPAARTVSLLTHHLFVGLRRERILAELEDGFAWLAGQPRAAAYATFVTGPSRTADIERSLTIGVQGPRRLTVALLP